MGIAAQHLLASFDELAEADKQEVAVEILRRTLNLEIAALSDDELIQGAEELFLELDRREARDADA